MEINFDSDRSCPTICQEKDKYVSDGLQLLQSSQDVHSLRGHPKILENSLNEFSSGANQFASKCCDDSEHEKVFRGPVTQSTQPEFKPNGSMSSPTKAYIYNSQVNRSDSLLRTKSKDINVGSSKLLKSENKKGLSNIHRLTSV